jgi:hypothetical protein
VTYTSPAVELRESIGAPFVVGYIISPTWTDQADAENQE